MENIKVICHMLISIDGKVTGSYLENKHISECLDHYYRIHRELNGDAFACGRVTMEGSFTHEFDPDLSKYDGSDVVFDDFVANHCQTKYAVAFDRKGKLGWKNGTLFDEDEGYNNAYIIEVLTEDVSCEYLAYLKDLGISYIFAGEKELNLSIALSKLKQFFNINRILLEGGSIINGAFQKDNLIDELSIVLVPLVGNTIDKPLFYNSNISIYKLENIKKYNETLWINYKR